VGLHTALSSLYGEQPIKLAAPEENKPTFNKPVFDKMVRWLHKKKGFTPEMLAEKPAQDLINETNRILSQPITVLQDIPAELSAALEQNTYIFSGFKSYRQMHEVSGLLKAEDGGIKPFNAFKEDVQKLHSTYNERYLEAEYNFATHSVQSAVKWQDLENDGDRYNLQYRTANDGKVREEHQSLHNTTLPASDPFWDSYYPPNGWNCRCTAVQVLKSKYDSSDSAEAIALGNAMTDTPKLRIFRFNPGKTKQVFPPKHPYLPKDCAGCNKNSIGLAYGKGRPECAACKIIQEKSNTVSISKKKYESYGNEWKKEFFNPQNGGYLVTEKSRVEQSKKNKQELAKYNKEKSMCEVFAKNGDRMEHLSEIPRVSSPDVTINGIKGDLKQARSHNNILNYAKKANTKQGANVVLFEFDKMTPQIHEELNKIAAKGIKGKYYITGKEDDIYLF